MSHFLLNAGNPYAQTACPDCMVEALRRGVYRDESGELRPALGTSGHAKCACGSMGPHMLSNDDRRGWFLGHKRSPRT